MDPLSMTASIITILKLTTTLTGYINDVRDATAEQANVAVEASSLYSLLTSLRFRVEAARSDDPWFNQVKMLGVHGGPLDQFKDVLEKMVDQIAFTRKRDQIKSALMWKFSRSEVENALKRMERLKLFINCALTGDLLTLSQATYDDVVILKKQTETLHIRTERLHSHADQELQNRLSRWLGLPDPSTNFQAALEKRHPETGLWLVDGQQFDRWKSSASSLMWLHGNAGCGKTVLSAASLQEITQLKGTQSDTVIGYFYFDFNDTEKQASERAIRSLLFQFALQQQNRLQTLEELYQRYGNGQQQPAEEAIRSLLKDAVACTGHKYIILDALDECANREDFLIFIRELVQSQQKGLRIMITSRREKDIQEQLGSIAKYDINIQSAIVDEDIRIYVRNRLATDSKLKKWPAKVQEDIVATLMKKADGMFRWAYCQLESIRQCVKLSALRKALSTLPKTLYETYDRIIRGIESAGQRQDAITALRWLCFSKVPLYLSQVIEVLAIENGENGGFCPDERLPDPADIMVVCSSLISCSQTDEESNSMPQLRSKSQEKDATMEKTRIRLAHFSVKEYLLSDRCLLALDFQAPVCHMAMAEDCLHYLLYPFKNLPMTQDLVDQYPLFRYAAKSWWQHARAAEDKLSPTVINLAQKLLMNKESGVLPWVQLSDIDHQRKGVQLSLSITNVAPPLYYAASIGLLQVVENIMPRIVDINAEGGTCGNALQVAAFNGHGNIVQALLDAGADLKATGGCFGNALQAASVKGYEKVVQALLDAGADLNVKGGYYGNALQAASVKGHERVVQILLNAGADVNAKGRFYGTALQVASRNGHEKVVQILLDAEADVNAEGPHGTALKRACVGSHEKIVQMLLDAGADVNAEGGRYSGSALQEASGVGHEKMVHILLDAGADVNAEGVHGTALQIASAKGHEEVVRVLLNAEVDVNAEGSDGTALQRACVEDHEKIVQMLLDAEADVNAEGSNGTALHEASRNGREKVVQILLNAGADVNAKGRFYGTALQVASKNGHEKVVQILLDAEAVANVEK